MDMKHLLYFLPLILAAGCSGNGHPRSVTTEGNSPAKENVTSVTSGRKPESVPQTAETGVRIHFLGHDILCGDDLGKELERISAEDCNLNYDPESQNLTIYGTTFHVNRSKDQRSFMLMSSVQPDSRQMTVVIQAISRHHGREYLEEPDHYTWSPSRDERYFDKVYPSIRLRRVRSDFGGTTIIFTF